ncbi:MAG: hypothetical protein FJ276_19735 [Planctomycetes bacterium]|nr:hypothetical protein [Planctomycetota bacterium]
MTKCTPNSEASKPSRPRKPHPDFPLFPHATNRWAKKVRGKLHYFGPWDDPDAALNKWLAQKDYLLAGKKPRSEADGLILKDACNEFLNAKRAAVEARELTARSLGDYLRACSRVIGQFGRQRVASDLDVDDFRELRESYVKTGWGPTRIANEITRTKCFFKWLYDAALIDRPVRYGNGFSKPSKNVMRRLNAKNGKKLFAADEVHEFLNQAEPQMKAMILLAINCGLGNRDCSDLEMRHLDLTRGWLDFPRGKTGIKRRA